MLEFKVSYESKSHIICAPHLVPHILRLSRYVYLQNCIYHDTIKPSCHYDISRATRFKLSTRVNQPEGSASLKSTVFILLAPTLVHFSHKRKV